MLVAVLAIGAAFPFQSLVDAEGFPLRADAFRGFKVVAVSGARELEDAARNVSIEDVNLRVIRVGAGAFRTSDTTIAAPPHAARLINERGRLVKVWIDPPAAKLSGFISDWLTGTSLSIGYQAVDPRAAVSAVPALTPPTGWLQALRQGITLALRRPVENHGPVGKGLLVMFLSAGGAVDSLYAERVRKAAEECAANGIAVIGLFPNVDETAADVSRYAAAADFKFTCAIDDGHAFADAYRATRTPEVFLLDSSLRVVYTGGIDSDSRGGAESVPYLQNAIKALSSGEAPVVQQTIPFGTEINRRF